MKEKDIERYLTEQVKQSGGRAYKFVSPGNNGVPDRLIVMKDGRIYFAEMKGPGGKLTPLQKLQIRRMSEMNCNVLVLGSIEDVDSFIESIKNLPSEFKSLMTHQNAKYGVWADEF